MTEKKIKSPQDEVTEEKMHWYAIHAYSGCEAYVAEVLKKRIVQFGKQDLFGEILVPREQIVEMKKGQKKTSERKYFPGYVLVQMVMNNDTWHFVKEIPKVLGFIGGTGDRPAPISDREVHAILDRVSSEVNKVKPKIIYEVGQVVRVKEGPFTDFNGVVEEVNYEKNRLRVAVLIFGRSTPVELEFGQVEKG